MTPPLTRDLPDSPTRLIVTADPDTGVDAPTNTTTGAATDIEPAADAESRSKLFDLSLTQLLGGSMAAATAAALGSRLGVVGTIAGAAVLSIVSAIAGTLYTNSMARAKDVVLLVRSRRDVALGRPGLAIPARLRRGWSRPDRATGRRALATAGAVFALAAAFLAGLQLATGAPVTGTSLGGRTAAGAVVDAPADSAGGAGTKADSESRTPQSGSDSASDARTGAAGSTGATTGVTAPSTGTPATPASDTPPSAASTADPVQQTPAATSPTTPASDGSTPSAPASTDAAGATAPAATPTP